MQHFDSEPNTDAGVSADADAIDAEKQTLRENVKTTLRTMDTAERHTDSLAACRRLWDMPVVRNATTVMLYLPLTTEVDVSPVALACFREGISVAVPKVDWERRDMQAVEVRSFDDQSIGNDVGSLRTPIGGRPLVPSAIDVIIVPALAYDTSCRRLGRGGGYYDRFLPRLRRAAHVIGIAFDRQIIDAAPVLPHDRPVHAVVTDRRLIEPSRATSS